ncbi:MAG: YraN family protein [Candidatus Omnitrophota bacterium]
MSLYKISTGKKGEALALDFLKKQGYKILQKNYKTKLGEIDIIGRDGPYTSFIEVKARTGKRFGLPEESVDIKKQIKLTNVALYYIKEHAIKDTLLRFDVVSIEDVNSSSPEIKLIKNAFEVKPWR